MMNNDMTYKMGRILTWLCGLSSWVLLLLWFAMAVNCRLGLGHWPEPMTENYSSGAYELLESLFILCGYFALFLAGPVLLITLAVRFKDLRTRLRAILYVTGWAFLFFVIWLDPTSFTEWWFD
jgi:hypothetical protein